MNSYRRLSRPLVFMLASCLSWTAPAVDCWATSGLVQMQQASRTKLDVSKGDIKIGVSGISGFSPEGTEETQANREGYHIVGQTSQYSITVEADASADLLLEDVNISQVDEDVGALRIEEASKGDVTVTLKGHNVLKGGSHCAGLEKSCNQTSCVRAGSQCDCGILTIQCERFREEGHVCNEECGTLVASGVNGGAGIGGGDGRKANRIRILGGHISASGGYGSAGVGGGYYCEATNVEVTGGEVSAVAGEGNVALGGVDSSDSNAIRGDCIVEAGSAGGAEVFKGILLTGNAGTIHGAVNISKDGAAGILKDKTLTREDGGRLILPDGVSWTVDNTLRVQSEASANALTREEENVSENREEEPQEDQNEPKKETVSLNAGTPLAKGIYGQTLNQLEVTDQTVEGGVPGSWSWAQEDNPDKTYPIVDGKVSYTRVFTPDSPDRQGIRVKIVPEISYLETNKEVTILSPKSPNGKNGWYTGNVVLEAPDGYQVFHSRSVGWVEELVVPDDGGSGDYEYYLREAGTNKTTNVKTIRLNIDSLPPIVENATVTHVDGGARVRVKAKDDTSLTEQVSGPRYFYCLVQPESTAKSLGRKAVVKNKATKNNLTGDFTFTNLEAGSQYRLFAVVADEAGNMSEVTEQTFTAR